MKKNHLILLSIIIVAVCSCKKDLPNTEPDSNQAGLKNLSELNIPFMTKGELNEFDADNEIVDFDLARRIALIDMSINGYFEKQGWANCKLSEVPVVIWGLDNRPQEYDFIVLDHNNNTLGTVRLHARKTSAMQIRHMTHQVDDYNVYNTKAGVRGVRICADNFGNRYVTQATKSGIISSGISLGTGKLVTGLEYMTNDQILYRMKTEILPGMLLNPQQIGESIQVMEEELAEETLAASQFWSIVDQNESAIYNSTLNDNVSNVSPTIKKVVKDIYTIEGTIQDPIPLPDIDTTLKSPYRQMTVLYDREVAWIKEYDDAYRNFNYFDDEWCGPWVVAFIMSANYNRFDISPKQFDKEGYTVQGGKFRGAMWPGNMSAAIKDYSTKNYKGNITMGKGTLKRKNTYWHIRTGNSAVRALILWEGTSTTAHWTHIYGSYRIERWLWYNYYFLQADNGSYVGKNDRWTRDPSVGLDNYKTLQWFDVVYPITECKLKQ